jgi:hypothetical protein
MTAIVTQGITVSIETALAGSKTISGASKANPCIITATGHGYTTGDIIKVDSVSGMYQINNRAFVVDLTAVLASPQTNKLALKGVDSTNYFTYGSGGKAYKATMTAVGGISAIPTLWGGTTPMVNTTTLASLVQEQSPGLATMGSTTFDCIYDPSDAGQAALWYAKESLAPKVVTVTLKDGRVSACVAYINSFTATAAANEVIRGTIELAVLQGWSIFA